ncbi:17304_t:CDS:1, partial [Dentiscutata heterogama]
YMEIDISGVSLKIVEDIRGSLIDVGRSKVMSWQKEIKPMNVSGNSS